MYRTYWEQVSDQFGAETLTREKLPNEQQLIEIRRGSMLVRFYAKVDALHDSSVASRALFRTILSVMGDARWAEWSSAAGRTLPACLVKP